MCGIVGHTGPLTASDRSLTVLLDGLSRLEYRGYDSAGVALVTADGLSVTKAAGKLEHLRAELDAAPPAPATAGIGHTRWATHGGPSSANAHPHRAGRLAVVHNGIIENFRPLRAEVEAAGRTLLSSTDTEVAAHVLDLDYARRLEAAGAGADPAAVLIESVRAVTARLEGSFALLAVTELAPGTIVAARRSSPLVIGLGDGESFLGSDVAAFVSCTRRAAEVGDDQVVLLRGGQVTVWDAAGAVVEPRTWEVSWDASAAVKGGYETFMDKEIHEQPAAVADTLRGRVDERGEIQLDEMRIDPAVLRSVDKIIVIACGTASYAGHVAKYAIEHWCRVPVEIELAHEFRYRDPVVSEKTLTVAVSQSGETMDTIQAVRHAREQGSKVLAIVNTYGSTIAREADAVLYTHAGPEVAVASTKAFLAQITACYLLGLYLAQLRGNKWPDEVADYLAHLARMPEKIQDLLDGQEERVRALATELAGKTSFLFLGRHVGYPVALEGALKLKELAYVHAEGFAAGELKHGPIALVEEGLPVFVIVPTPRRPVLHDKVVSNIQEVRARGARTIVIAEEGDLTVEPFADDVIRVPQAPTLMWPLLTVVPLQVFAAALARAKGLDIDQPRNLAKSVTVE
ncbi:glutamine--fructose-6-phosphate transaminase (isomerizing) [Actinomyces sp. 186855]|uniref:glutamine--fructose-6-phosphate transaminase (isomerizing) n=4 Tax=Actinomyces TaxID=1654 RepID=UPI00201727CD|nr:MULTISPECIES: glutamine--fructose-6-phosphate transaminase (isomerizing) [unclassified Actinomyces]MCL3778723.1 glutamine--fructose-6-phosphate transaminase (isomerizing) [Actinomyces sp. AC-20-1]MCL3791231.1 glutamine--fructose-6-phosphate transaminase (isomerizing) [Actinomyces sp. 186855]MCL3793734.1 glutamine--fructose-6-phosphate transaminase (isomerizing) [Actinomyces sp. 217892]